MWFEREEEEEEEMVYIPNETWYPCLMVLYYCLSYLCMCRWLLDSFITNQADPHAFGQVFITSVSPGMLC